MLDLDNARKGLKAVSATDLQTKLYGRKLAEAREALGLSQSEAGERLGKARETLSLIERGVFSYAPNPREMRDYFELYGIPEVEQLSALGYAVNPLVIEGLGELTAEEVGLVNTFRGLTATLRRIAIRLVSALAADPQHHQT